MSDDERVTKPFKFVTGTKLPGPFSCLQNSLGWGKWGHGLIGSDHANRAIESVANIHRSWYATHSHIIQVFVVQGTRGVVGGSGWLADERVGESPLCGTKGRGRRGHQRKKGCRERPSNDDSGTMMHRSSRWDMTSDVQ